MDPFCLNCFQILKRKVWVFWVLRTKTSHQEQEELYPLLDHAAARLVKKLFAAALLSFS